MSLAFQNAKEAIVEEQASRILLVEDNAGIRAALVLFLEREGFVVVAVAEYQRALELVEGELFDALVADLDLPGGTGLDLLQSARLRRPRMLSILMTGYGCSAIRKEAEALDLSAYLEKPFDPAELLSVLRSKVPSYSSSVPFSSARTS